MTSQARTLPHISVMNTWPARRPAQLSHISDVLPFSSPLCLFSENYLPTVFTFTPGERLHLLLYSQQRGHRLNPVPQILQTNIFIGAVLIVVVIGDGNADAGRLHVIREDVKRDTASERGHFDYASAGAFDRGDYRLRDRQIHGSARRIVPALTDHLGDFRVFQPRGLIGFGFDYLIALRADVFDHAIDGLDVIDALDQANVYRGRGGRRDHVARCRADRRTQKTANVERRQVQQLDQPLTGPFGPSDSQLAPQRRVVVGGRGRRAFFSLGQGLDAVVKAFDQHAPVIILHRGEQLRQHHRGIGRPIAVMSAVKLAARAVDGDLHPRHAARAEIDLLPPRLVDRPVADQPRVGFQN